VSEVDRSLDQKIADVGNGSLTAVNRHQKRDQTAFARTSATASAAIGVLGKIGRRGPASHRALPRPHLPTAVTRAAVAMKPPRVYGSAMDR
jgi:hypothetical protein